MVEGFLFSEESRRVQLQPSTQSVLYSSTVGGSMDIDVPSISSAAPSMPQIEQPGNSNAAAPVLAPGQSSTTPNWSQPGAGSIRYLSGCQTMYECTTSNTRIIFTCRICVLFAFRCKPSLTCYSSNIAIHANVHVLVISIY